MSYFYKYKFVSPESLYARIREELRSYFDAGVVDDLLFPIWTDDCLRKLGRSSYKIENALLFMENFEARLPPDFVAPREVWMTSSILSPIYRKPGAFYQQITTVLDKPFDACNPAVNCDPCNPDILVVNTKTNTEITHPIRLKYLLKPGNIHVHDKFRHGLHDGMGCLNFSSTCEDTFDIRDNKLITNFRHGDVFLIYYSSQSDNNGYQLIPENFRVQDYIRAYLRQKVFEQLFNGITDESFQQIEKKYQMYKQQADEAFIMADIEVKKKTIYERAYAIRRDEHRLDKYQLDHWWHKWRGGTWPASSWGWND